MKHELWLGILSGLKQKRAGRRKLKKVAMVAILSFVLICGLAIWVGISGIYFLKNTLQSQDLATHVDSAKAKFQKLPNLAAAGCLDKTQSLLRMSTWVGRPIMENLTDLKTACLKSSEGIGTSNPLCTGADCESIKRHIRTAEKGETT